jgi:hypothetical protein
MNVLLLLGLLLRVLKITSDRKEGLKQRHGIGKIFNRLVVIFWISRNLLTAFDLRDTVKERSYPNKISGPQPVIMQISESLETV